MHLMAWLVSAAACISSLAVSHRCSAWLVLKLAVAAIVGGMLLVVLIGLGLRKMHMEPSDAVLTVMMQLLMTITAIGLFNMMNLASRGMVGAQGTFHKRYNAKNLRRFPVSFVVGEASQIKKFATAFWCVGSVLILYAIWFKMTVPARA